MTRTLHIAAAMLAVAALALLTARSEVRAQDETEADPAAAEDMAPVPVLNTYQTMEAFFEPPFLILEETLAEEPADRRGWRDIRNSAYALAEATNLLFSRNDMDYMGTEEWNKLSVEGRQAAVKLGDAAREQDFAKTKEAWKVMVQSCNKCHETFEPDLAPVFDVE